MYSSEEFQLEGAADVEEVRRWSEERADGRLVTIYAVLDVGGAEVWFV